MTQQQQLYKTLIAGQYKIALKMKQGAFGTVYLAKNKVGKEFAIKIGKGKNSDEITTQKQIYVQLADTGSPTGFIRSYESGEIQCRSFLVMELLGSDLDDLANRSSLKRLSLKSSLMVGRQVLDRLEVLHGLGYLHRDIKPDNLAVGIREHSKTIYLIDFGLAKKINPLNKQPRKNGTLVGTYRFMSVNCHNGLELSARDDLQSLCFMIMYFIEGRLPWQGNRIDTKQGLEHIKNGKAKITPKDFTRNIPAELFEMLKYIREVKFNAVPNYQYLKSLIISAMESHGFEDDSKFDWVKELNETQKQGQRRKSKQKSPPRIEEKQKKQSLVNQFDRQIVAVFKFCNQPDMVSTMKDTKPKRQPEPPVRPIRPETRQNTIRPQSAQKPVQFDSRQYTRNQNANYQGPRIIINKEAKYKI